MRFITFEIFQAHLRLDRRVSKSEKIKLVQEILIKVGLIGCVDTRIGDTNRGKTLSGGEKKRLSFASELLTKPSLLFCDEPTTGLGKIFNLTSSVNINLCVLQMHTVPSN